MSEDGNNAGIIRGVDSQPDLRTLTRVTESQIKRTGTNPTPQTSKPINFSPPGQGQPTAPAPAPAAKPSSGSGSDDPERGRADGNRLEVEMKVRFALVFKSGVTEVARVEGRPRPADLLTVEDVQEKLIACEQYVERLTGLRMHIEAQDYDTEWGNRKMPGGAYGVPADALRAQLRDARREEDDW